MGIKKGDVVAIQVDQDQPESHRFRVVAATKHGYRGTWIDGPLAGRDALLERSIVVHRGRLPVQVSEK